LKDRKDEKVERSDGENVKVMRGLSAQARRLKLVQLADAIVTVSGEVRTALVLELALTMARPALPLFFTGGDSATHWGDNRSYYVARLGIVDEDARALETFDLATSDRDERDACIARIVTTITRVISRTCLVLMPFRTELDAEYKALTEVIRGEGFHPIRLDRELYAGDVRETVVRLLRECEAIIADITTRSPNVMYEVGLAHALGRKPLLLWQGSPRFDRPRSAFLPAAAAPGNRAGIGGRRGAENLPRRNQNRRLIVPVSVANSQCVADSYPRLVATFLGKGTEGFGSDDRFDRRSGLAISVV